MTLLGGAGERGADGDDLPHTSGELLRDLTGVDTAQAPADQAHRFAASAGEFKHVPC